MDLFETLKQFKKIEADPVAKENSKRVILATLPREGWSIRRVFAGIFETGIAVALAVFAVMAISGQFANSPVAPVQLSVINPDTLRAEAQAVDLQIQLAQLSYQESTTTTQTTTPLAAPIRAAQLAKPLTPAAVANTSPSGTSTSTSTSTASSSVSIDQALEALTQ